jgi:uncharacterized membrane-anchored protein YitT (DUF2179 family)
MAAMPKLILTCAILGVLFCALWGPSLFVALRLHRRGDWAAVRALRLLWPLQLVLAAGLMFAADAAGVSNPIGYGIVIIIGVSIAGAAAFAAWRLVLGFIAR